MELLRYPDLRLRIANERLQTYGPQEAEKVAQMFRIMAEADGIALAAPQVGWNVRLFILSVPDPKSGEAVQKVIWNPRLETMGPKIRMPEGCISFPGVRAEIERWTRARLTGMSPEGWIDMILDGLFAQAAQHELDHLDSILIIDRMTSSDYKANAAIIEALERTVRERTRV